MKTTTEQEQEIITLTEVNDYDLEMLKALALAEREIFTKVLLENTNVTKVINDKFNTSFTYEELISEAFKHYYEVDVCAEMFKRNYNLVSKSIKRQTATETANADISILTKAVKSFYVKCLKKMMTEEQIIKELLKQKVSDDLISQVCLSHKKVTA